VKRAAPGSPLPRRLPGALGTDQEEVSRYTGGPSKSRCTPEAKVAELVDALALGASGETREGSSPSFRTRCAAAHTLFAMFFGFLQLKDFRQCRYLSPLPAGSSGVSK
jgi:hypothetical protein